MTCNAFDVILLLVFGRWEGPYLFSWFLALFSVQVYKIYSI